MLFVFKYSLVTLVSLFVGSFSAANIVFPFLFGKNEKAAELGNKEGFNIIAPIIWSGIVYGTYLAMSSYFPEYLIFAMIVYTISFLGTLIKGFKTYR